MAVRPLYTGVALAARVTCQESKKKKSHFFPPHDYNTNNMARNRRNARNKRSLRFKNRKSSAIRARKSNRKRSKSRGKKKSSAKRLTRRQNKRVNIASFKGYQPKTKRITLKYANIQGFDGIASGSAVKWIFYANGMFDLLDQVGGHQPYLFDQMALLYNEYKVIGAKIRLTEQIGELGHDGGTTMWYCVVGGHSDTFNTRIDIGQKTSTHLESGRLKLSNIKQFPSQQYMEGQDRRFPQVLQASFSLKSFKSVLNETNPKDLWIPVTADPNGTTQPLFQFDVVLDNRVGNDTGVNLDPARVPVLGLDKQFWMEIEYDVIFRDPKVITPS